MRNDFWVAREKNGKFYMYKEKPIYDKKRKFWRVTEEVNPNEYYFGERQLPQDMFLEITFANSPKKVKIIIDE